MSTANTYLQLYSKWEENAEIERVISVEGEY